MEELGQCDVVKDGELTPDALFKVIIIGDAGVGKSCILRRATKDEFLESYDVTIGAASTSFLVRIQQKLVKLQLWDTAGQENFRSMIRVFYKGSHGAILVYDITRQDTFSKLEDWLMEIKENAVPDVMICLVGNQKDNRQKREVSTEDGVAFARVHSLAHFIETSAKTGEGVTELFLDVAKSLYLQYNIPAATFHNHSKTLKDTKAKKGKGCCK